MTKVSFYTIKFKETASEQGISFMLSSTCIEKGETILEVAIPGGDNCILQSPGSGSLVIRGNIYEVCSRGGIPF